MSSKLKTERYSTGKYSVYTPAPYPRLVGHIVKMFGPKWHAEAGRDLGYFSTKKLAVDAIAKELDNE